MKELETLEKKIKGYGFDSLVFRYKLAREEQMRAEMKDKYCDNRDKARCNAERDIMRFIQILDDLIGEHD